MASPYHLYSHNYSDRGCSFSSRICSFSFFLLSHLASHKTGHSHHLAQESDKEHFDLERELAWRLELSLAWPLVSVLAWVLAWVSRGVLALVWGPAALHHFDQTVLQHAAGTQEGTSPHGTSQCSGRLVSTPRKRRACSLSGTPVAAGYIGTHTWQYLGTLCTNSPARRSVVCWRTQFLVGCRKHLLWSIASCQNQARRRRSAAGQRHNHANEGGIGFSS